MTAVLSYLLTVLLKNLLTALLEYLNMFDILLVLPDLFVKATLTTHCYSSCNSSTLSCFGFVSL